MIGEPTVQEIEMNNGIGEVDLVIEDQTESTQPAEPIPNALDKFMARLELPGVDGQPLSDLQKQVKGFIIYALSFRPSAEDSTNLTSLMVIEIRDVFNISPSLGYRFGYRYGLQTVTQVHQKYFMWPTAAKCIITLNGDDYITAQGGEWYRDGRLLYVSYIRTRETHGVQPLTQLLTILALGEAFGVMDRELYLAANQMLDLVKPTAGLVNSRLRNTRLAIDSTGVQIASYHKDGYYSPNGEPVDVVVGSGAGQWTTVQL